MHDRNVDEIMSAFSKQRGRFSEEFQKPPTTLIFRIEFFTIEMEGGGDMY
jgi:hypothetical protein